MKTCHVEQGGDIRFFDLLERMQKRIMEKTSYFGITAYKNPLDFWVYQEIICAQKPDVIIEIGNCFGGSTLALAHLLDNLGHGRVIAVDITHAYIHERAKRHPRITWIEGDACGAYPRVADLVAPGETVLIIEDSAHTYDNTLAVLKQYAGLIPEGGYFIVEDGICHHGVEVGPSPGPYEACEAFVRESPAFEIDRECESFCITWNPKGYLRRKSGAPAAT